jgi:tetratricopeptide (TPR) repeat protein
MITSDVANEAATLLQQGLAAVNAGDNEQAKAALRRSAELDPDNETVWLWLASLHSDLPFVAHCLQRALVINPDNAAAAQALQAVTGKIQKGQQAIAGGPLVGSQEEFDSGPLRPEQVNDFDFEELKRRGIVAGKGGRREEARAYLLAATDKNESDIEVWYWLSTVIDDPEDKQIALENVLALDPLNESAQVALQENAHLLEQARHNRPSEANPSSWESLPEVSYGTLSETSSPSGLPDLESMRSSLGFESSSNVTIGTDSKLFARAGTMDNEDSNQAPQDKKEDTDTWVINGKYRVLSSTEVAGGKGYLACDVKKLTYYMLRAQDRELSELKKTGANYIVYKGTPYTVVAVDTNGLTLRQFISTVGALPPDLAVRYGLAMLKTLAAEHDKGPILTARKNVTPDTVALNALGEVVLEPPAAHVAAPRSSAMTTPFMPTEQAQHGTLAPTSDIFAIGALLFYMLTGSPPPDAGRIPRKQAGMFVPGEFAGFPEVPEDMVQVIATALQPNPTDRYPSAAEMARALKETAAGHQVPRELPRVPVKAVLAAAAVLGVALVAGLIVTGKLQFTVPSLGFINQASAPQVTPAPAVVEPTAIPMPPLGRAIINSVDSRRFPSNLLYFSALDTTGAPMFGLNSGSVKVKENGVEINSMQVTELRKTTDAISVIVALDTSEKMSGKYMDNAKTAIHILADRLQPGDNMALITFGDNARLALDYTVSKQQFIAGVDGQGPGGKPAMVEAVAGAAVSALGQLQGGYTSLVIVTNAALPKGKAGALKPAVDNMIKAARTANLPVFIVALDKANINEEAVNQLAAGTGGGAFYADPPDTGGAGEAIKKVEAQLHNVYKITYDSPSPSPQADHNLELAVTAGGATHTDKRSYQHWQR